MRREILIFLLLGWFSIQIDGQTVLYPGDIAIVGIQTDNPDDFSFIFLTSIQKHTVLFFTDCGVKADGSFRNGEGGLRYVAPRDLAPGTLVDFIRDSSDFFKANDAVLGSRGFNLSSSGDQIIAFQDSSIHPHYLFAIQTNSSKWQDDCTNSNISSLPSGLVEGFSAFCAGKDTGSGNYWHNATVKAGPPGITRSKVLKELTNRTNWKFGNSIFPLLSENIIIAPDSNRHIILTKDCDTIYNINDSIHIEVSESNVNRLSIWLRNLNLKDSLIILNQWPSALRQLNFKIPGFAICDSFQIEFEDADFPGFIHRTSTWLIKDTIPLQFTGIHENLVKPGDSVTLIFNKSMLPLAKNLVLRNLNNPSDSIILAYSLGEITMRGNELTLLLKVVKAGNRYLIEIPEGWMSDMKGNVFVGIDKYKYPIIEVMAEPAIDSVAPQLISISPSLDEPIKPDQKISFVFSEPLYSTEGDITDPDILGDIISVEDINGDNYYDFTIEFDSLFRSFSIQPIGLEEGKSYYIYMYGFSDSTGNECDEFDFSFETLTKTSVEKKLIPGKFFDLYPNPAEDYIQISGKNLLNSKIEILDFFGRPELIKITEKSNENARLNIRALPTGAYVIRVFFSNQVSQQRFIKQ